MDFLDRVKLVLSIETEWARNPELDFPEWDRVRKHMYELLGEAGDEARCSHAMRSTDGRICLHCGRRVTPENTTLPKATVSEIGRRA